MAILYSLTYSICCLVFGSFNTYFRYWGEDILVHELAHALELAARYVIPGFSKKLNNAYNDAIGNGLWYETYAGSKVTEYIVSVK